MSLSKTELEQYLQKLNPNLKVNSIKAYSVAIRNIAKNCNVSSSPDDFYKNKNVIMKYLHDLQDFKKRKLQIASLLLFLKEKLSKEDEQKLKNIMLEDIKLTDEELKTQEMSETQKRNWMSWEEVLAIRDALEKQVGSLLKKKTVNVLQYNRLVDYIIVCLYTYQPPRRLVDYIFMRPIGYPAKLITEDSNYIDIKKGEFVFQNYKTKSAYNDQRVKINPTLMGILKDFCKIKLPEGFEPEDAKDKWLILDTKGNQFNSSKLSQRLSSIFNKAGFSVNMLRHIYISEQVLPDQKKLLEMEQKASDMGHSVSTQQLYKKFPDKK